MLKLYDHEKQVNICKEMEKEWFHKRITCLKGFCLACEKLPAYCLSIKEEKMSD